MWWNDFWDSVGNSFGLLNGSSFGYLWWSGAGSDIGELTILGGAVALYKAHTCHVDGCWRISRHKHTQDGQEYALCRKHHPNIPDQITAEMMQSNKEQP